MVFHHFAMFRGEPDCTDSLQEKELDGAGRGREKRNRASKHEFPVMEHTTTPNIQENFQRYYADGEDYVKENPTKSALVAMGAGFLLAQLPLRWMFIAIIKLLFLVVKPVTFIY